jgi:hypothetical protein
MKKVVEKTNPSDNNGLPRCLTREAGLVAGAILPHFSAIVQGDVVHTLAYPSPKVGVDRASFPGNLFTG